MQMKHTKLTPNLIVADVSRSVAFYCDVLGFERGMSVPDEPPFVFASVTHGGIEIFFNQQKAAAEDLAVFAGPIGGSLTLFIETDDLNAVYERAKKAGAPIAMEPKDQFYGMREFILRDPDGWMVQFAMRI